MATVKATEIKLDILKGCFELQLAKYKPTPTGSNITSNIEAGYWEVYRF